MKLSTLLLLLIISAVQPAAAQIFGGAQAFGGGTVGAAGASIAMEVASTGLDSTEITNLLATPITLAAAGGASKVHTPIASTVNFAYGGVAYTTGGTSTVYLAPSTMTTTAGVQIILDSDVRGTNTRSNNSQSFINSGYAASTEDPRNGALQIKNGGTHEYATGNSTMSVEILYTTLGGN